MSRADGCDECVVKRGRDGKLHHQPDCPEMFFRKRDGTPDRTKPRGVPMQPRPER